MHSDNFTFIYVAYLPMVLHKTYKIVLFTSGKLKLGGCRKFRTVYEGKSEINS